MAAERVGQIQVEVISTNIVLDSKGSVSLKILGAVPDDSSDGRTYLDSPANRYVYLSAREALKLAVILIRAAESIYDDESKDLRQLVKTRERQIAALEREHGL